MLPTVVFAVVGLARDIVLGVVQSDEDGLVGAAVATRVVHPYLRPVSTVVSTAIAVIGKTEMPLLQFLQGKFVGFVGGSPAGLVIVAVEDRAGIVEQHLAQHGLGQTGGDTSEVLCLVAPAGRQHISGALEVGADEVDTVFGGLAWHDEVGSVATLA